MEGARSEPALEKKGRGRQRQVAEEAEDYAAMDAAQAMARLKTLAQQMYQHARDLEFEDAARVRDQIRRLKDAALRGSGRPMGAQPSRRIPSRHCGAARNTLANEKR